MNIIKSRHTLSYCNTCQCEMVRCVDCGNNCCNGTERCTNCSEAYEHQKIYYDDSSKIEFAKKENVKRKKGEPLTFL